VRIAGWAGRVVEDLSSQRAHLDSLVAFLPVGGLWTWCGTQSGQLVEFLPVGGIRTWCGTQSGQLVDCGLGVFHLPFWDFGSWWLIFAS
jgi:hypothetical protein